LGSLRTVTAGCGSLLFSAAFSLSISMERPKIAGLPFFVASSMYILSYIQTKSFLNHHQTSKCDSERNNQTTTSLLDATNHRLNNVSNMIFGNIPTKTTEESLNLLNSSHGINVTNETSTPTDRGEISTISPPSLHQIRYHEDNDDVFAMTTSSPSSSLSPHKQVQLGPHSFHHHHQIGGQSILSSNTETSDDDPSFGYSILVEGR